MQKMYSAAAALIKCYLGEMREKMGLTPRETVCKTTLVEDKLVIFLVHDRLKNLLEKQLTIRKPRFAKVTYERKNRNRWFIAIEADGGESFFFARQLQRILYRINSPEEKKRYDKKNQDFLREVVAETVKKANQDPADFIPETYFEKKIYHLLIRINGVAFEFKNASVDLLARNISQQIPGFFRVISETK